MVTLCLFLCGTLALAVGTSHWTQQSEADFKAGSFDNVVATNRSELKLSREVKTLLSSDARVSAVYALAEGPDGTIYAGTGPQGVLLSIKQGVVKTVAIYGNDANIFSLLFDKQGRLLVGTGGEKGKIYRINHPSEPVATAPVTTQPAGDEIFSSDGVQYIWAMTQSADGTVYAATGPNGQLFSIDADGKSKVLFECDENNLLSLITDGKDNLYIGTDPNGLVYRINRKSGEGFILYDAGESEVRSLAMDREGNLYAATADVNEPPKTAAESDATERNGHPESAGQPAKDIPSEPPTTPKPPALPTPGPSEPKPIPPQTKNSTTRPLSLMDDPGDQPTPTPGAPDEPQANPTMPSAQQPSAAIHDVAQKASAGNAIYRITPDGFVSEVFREPVTIYSMIENNGVLLAGTGREGTVYQISPAAEETASIAKVDPKDVLCLLQAKDGQIWMGLANSGQISVLGAGFASTGSYTSPPLDAKQVSRFGKINLHGLLPDGTSLTVSTRSGNVEDPTNKGWSKWTNEQPAAEYVQVSTPAARFLQYRLTFNSTDGKQTPSIGSVSTGYQTPNLAPVIHSLKLSPSAANVTKPPAQQQADAESPALPTPSPIKTIAWDASDPNADTLRFSLYFRTSRGGQWILLKDKLTDQTYDWNTRDVADGRYQVKVVASDAAANPVGQGKSASRVSEEIVVNNTPPSIGDLKATSGKGQAKIAARVTDQWGTVAALAYAVDSIDDWQAVLPVDTIADSPDESYDFVAGGLSAGPHQVTLRATDSQGNQAFTTVAVTVEAGPSSKD